MKKSKWTKYHWIKSCAPKPVSFKLRDLRTNTIIEGRNVRQFCKTNNLGPNSHIGIYFLLGKRLSSYKHFVLPNFPLSKLSALKTNKYFKNVPVSPSFPKALKG